MSGRLVSIAIDCDISCWTPTPSCRKWWEDSAHSCRRGTVEFVCRTARVTTRSAKWHSACAMAFRPSTASLSKNWLTLHRRHALRDTSTTCTSAFMSRVGRRRSESLADLVYRPASTLAKLPSASGLIEV